MPPARRTATGAAGSALVSLRQANAV